MAVRNLTIGLCSVAVALSVLMLVPKRAQAIDDVLTEVGHAQCSADVVTVAPANGLALTQRCPIKFKTPFGGTPNVMVQGCTTDDDGVRSCNNDDVPDRNNFGETVGYHPRVFKVIEVATDHFTVELYREGGEHHQNPQQVYLDYVVNGPRLFRTSGTAKYMVVNVIYAPPGAANGGRQSSIIYGQGSTTGTTTSASQTFKSDNSMSLEQKASFVFGDDISAGLDGSTSSTDSQSLDIRQIKTASLQIFGPQADGVDHNFDQIYLVFVPKVDLGLSSSSSSWNLEGSNRLPVAITVGHLNGRIPWQANNDPELLALTNAGITPAEYPDILAADPLASGAPSPDYGAVSPASVPKNRYVYVREFDYKPPPSLNAVPELGTYTENDSSLLTVKSEAIDSHDVTFSIAGGVDLDLGEEEDATFKDSKKWTWTNESSNSTLNGISKSVTIAVGGPAYNFPGTHGIRMMVYEDSIYHTFCFELVADNSKEIAAKGIVKDAAGSVAKWADVTLIDQNHVEHHATTNQYGEYSIHAHVDGPFTIVTAGIRKLVANAARSPANVNFGPSKAPE